tara:strand:- start:293 stop:466 length:174 start_codon:yes stop_codon:yes gene_type:complete
MKQSNIILIIYVIGILIGALVLDIWGSDTNVKKGLIALGWTAIFLIAYFYSDKEKNN